MQHSESAINTSKCKETMQLKVQINSWSHYQAEKDFHVSEGSLLNIQEVLVPQFRSDSQWLNNGNVQAAKGNWGFSIIWWFPVKSQCQSGSHVWAKQSLCLSSNRMYREVKPDPLTPSTLKSCDCKERSRFPLPSSALKETSLLIYLEALFDILLLQFFSINLILSHWAPC